jgi:N-acetyl-anhydromuramyl-L-alanine amidase AmpD
MTDIPEHLRGAFVLTPGLREQLGAAADDTERLNAAVLEALGALHGDHDGDAIEIDDDGIMHGTGVHFIPTVRTSKLATPAENGADPHVEGAVWHYTDTRNAGAVNLAQRIAAKGASKSCHVWIDRPGVIAQSASFERGTWHAGSDTAMLFRRNAAGWESLSPAQRGKVRGWGANAWAAGIELENVGEVRIGGVSAGVTRFMGWPFRMNYRDGTGKLVRPAIVPDDEVIQLEGKYWHAYTDEQARAALRVVAALVARYGLLRESLEWTHAAIDPTRRTDPGPAWTTHLAAILDSVFGPRR